MRRGAFGLPLLSHTGGEKSLPNLNVKVMDPALLLPAVHPRCEGNCGTAGCASEASETDYLSTFMRLAKEHEHFYGRHGRAFVCRRGPMALQNCSKMNRCERS